MPCAVCPRQFQDDWKERCRRRIGPIYRRISPKLSPSATPPRGQTVRYEYDAVGRVTSQTLPDGRTVLYRYDGNGNLVGLTPPGRPEHRFDYDAVNGSTGYQPPGVGPFDAATRYHYNRAKQPTRIDRPDGQALQFFYDAAGRMDSLLLPDVSLNIVYGASTCSSCGGQGLPQQIRRVDTGGAAQTLDYQYDGPVPVLEVSSGLVSGAVGFALDANLRLGSISAGGQTTHYRYNDDGALLQAGDLLLTRQDYTGNLVGTALGQVATTQGYNRYNEVASFAAVGAGSALISTTYVRDLLGRIVQKSETIQGVTTTYGYGYDVASRLVEVRENGAVVASYSFDANGNRVGGFDRFGPITATVDVQDRLLNYAGNTYTYTKNGELLQRHSRANGNPQVSTFTYDLLGNLTKVVLPDGRVIEYIIDGRNRRVGKKVDGVLVQGFLYQNQLEPVAELDGAGNVVSLFAYGSKANVPDYMVKGGVTYRIVSDHLGSPRLVVNAADGNVVQRIDYDEWGNVLYDSNPGFQPFGFAGGIDDRDTGLIRFGARDYDPQTGRWTAKDPILFAGGDGNLYGYVLGDPLSFIDALGLYTRVSFYQGSPLNPFGHIGIGSNTPITYGKYPASSASTVNTLALYPVAGEVHVDDLMKVQRTLVIDTNSIQDQILSEYINTHIVTPGPYDLDDNSCVDFVRGALAAAGIHFDSSINTPEGLFDTIDQLNKEKSSNECPVQ